MSDTKATVAVTDDSFNDDVLTSSTPKIDVDANPGTARDFQVVSIPTLILFKDGQPVKRIVGTKGKAALLRELADHV
jgi:thioredoxin 1